MWSELGNRVKGRNGSIHFLFYPLVKETVRLGSGQNLVIL